MTQVKQCRHEAAIQERIAKQNVITANLEATAAKQEAGVAKQAVTVAQAETAQVILNISCTHTHT
jgi:hypothetical protein